MNGMSSWKTTLLGIISQLPVLGAQVKTLLDDDPSTNPDWAIIMGSLAIVFALFKARDHDVSSEQAGIKG